jgi:hypothetical protein
VSNYSGVAGIYAIVNVPASLRGDAVDAYVGQAYDVARRWTEHLNRGGASRHLSNAIKKHWHVNRGITNPKCSLCTGQRKVSAKSQRG